MAMLIRLLPPGITLALLLISQSARAQGDDPYWGRDKALHFGVSFAVAGAGYAVSGLWLDSPTGRALAGGSLSLGLGLAKEGLDLAADLGHPSLRDLTWDVVGVVAGVGLALLIDLVLFPDPKSNGAPCTGPQLAVCVTPAQKSNCPNAFRSLKASTMRSAMPFSPW